MKNQFLQKIHQNQILKYELSDCGFEKKKSQNISFPLIVYICDS